jgi:hypothetical protein
LALRYGEVELQPPQGSTQQPIKVWAVYALEQDPPPGIPSGVEWMLLTTIPVLCTRDAKKCVEWYAGRWGIEVYHKTLKSGCRIKDRQLGTADRLEACLGLDMVVAWRILHLTHVGRETPHAPCTVFFTEPEWKALYMLVHKTTVLPEQPPTMYEAHRMVAGLGGYLGRKCDGPPGAQTTWRGLIYVDTAKEMYLIFTQRDVPQDLKTGP